MAILTQSIKTPVGELILGSLENRLCLADWKYRKMRSVIDGRIQANFNQIMEEGESPVLQNAEMQLQEYFNGTRTKFDLPLLFAGTEFQKQVWEKLLEVPYGKTLSYLNLSKKLDNPMAIRAVASANGANAISIIVPCHRIVGSNGELTGYAGGLTTKRKLLELENPDLKNQMVLF